MEFKNQNPKSKKGRFDDLDYIDWLNDESFNDISESDNNKQSAPYFKKRRKFNIDEINKDMRKSKSSKKVEFNVNFSLPTHSFDWIKLLEQKSIGFFRDVKKTIKPWALAVLFFVAISVLGFIGWNSLFGSDKTEQHVAGVSSELDDNGVPKPLNDPGFKIVVPSGREIPKDRIIYDSVRNFTKFDDEINGIPITVSQQPFPSIYSSNPEGGVSKIAKDFGAKDELFFDDQAMYYGQDVEGPQTLVLYKNDVLIFILTARPVEQVALQVYAANLE